MRKDRHLRLGLTAGLVAAMALGVVLGLGVIFPGFGRADPSTARVPAEVSVNLGDLALDIGGLGRYEATGLLEDVAGRYTLPPENAHIDRASRGVVPALNGRCLDVAETVALALEAAPGAAVDAVFSTRPPAVDLGDFPEAPVYSGLEAKQTVAVILNVAWGDEFLDSICALFEEAGGRLTICPVGEWLDGSEERAAWLAAAAGRGHEIGNHGYYNRPMTYDPAQIGRELDRTSDLIEEASGRRPVIFAPPMGEIDEGTLHAAAEGGCRTVMWSLDTVDWRREGVGIIVERVVTRVKAGDIILCHPTEQTGPAMEKILPVLAERGLRVVTVSELISPLLPLPAVAGPPDEETRD